MDFIHEPTLSSRNHNIICPFSIIGWWNCNFKSMLVKNFHYRKFNDWYNNSSSRKCCKKSGLWVCSRKCGLCRMESTAQNRRPRQVEFCSSHQLIPCASTMRVRKPLWIELSRPAIRSPDCFPTNCDQMLVLEGYQKFYFLWFHTC